MDERLRFVAQLLDGEAMTDVCREFGISRKTGHKIFNRYKEHGLEALSDRSRREQAGLEPSVPLGSVCSIWRTEPSRARSGSPRAPALTPVVDAVTGCSADRVHSAVNRKPPRSLKRSPSTYRPFLERADRPVDTID
jgi:transposase-like protein